MPNPDIPEIPVADLDRARGFYESILDARLAREKIGEGQLAVFPHAGKPDATGALIAHPQMAPSMSGNTIHFSAGDVAPVFERSARGVCEVVVPRIPLPEGMDVFVRFRGSEGNRVGPWSQP